MIVSNKCNHKKIFLVLAFFFLFLFSLGFLGNSVFAVDPPANQNPGGTHDGGSGYPVDGCAIDICYTIHQPYAGVSWVYYDFDEMGIPANQRDRIPYSKFINPQNTSEYPTGNKPLPTRKGDNAVTGCASRGSKGVYIFGYNRYYRKTKKPTGGMAMPLSFSMYYSEPDPKEYNYKNLGHHRVSWDEAKMNYTGKVYTGVDDPQRLADWNRGDFSWFCAWPPTPINEEKQPTPSNMTCSQLSGNFGAYYKGNTSADTGVVNHSYSGTLGHNSWQKNFQGKNYVFAKPGDRVQFYETFCFPIQQVGIQTGSSHVSSADPPGESNFQIFAQKNDSDNNQYLFGDSPVHDGSYHSIGRGNKRPFSGNGLETSDYGFTAYSPTQNASSEYGCQTNYYRMYAPKLTVGYQIPGFIDYQHGCNSADKTGSTCNYNILIFKISF